MFSIPDDPKKIKERIRRYERALRNEKKKFGGYDDSEQEAALSCLITRALYL